MSFFNLFGKREELEDDFESEVEDVDEKDENKEVNTVNLFDKPVHSTIWSSPEFENNIIVDIHMLSARKVIPYLSTWSFNREINIVHKLQIKKSLLQQKSPYLIGSIQIARDKTGNYKVINGQHRLHSLQEIINEDLEMKFDINCIFEVFSLNISDITNPSLSECTLIEKLFKLANSSLNFEKKDSVDSFCRDIILSLRGDEIYKNNIVDTEKLVYRPSINMKDFYENLKKYLPKKLYEMKVEEVVNMIKKKNNELSRINPNELYKNPKKSEKQYEKALNKRFFLNLSESRFGPDRWITELL